MIQARKTGQRSSQAVFGGRRVAGKQSCQKYVRRQDARHVHEKECSRANACYICALYMSLSRPSEQESGVTASARQRTTMGRIGKLGCCAAQVGKGRSDSRPSALQLIRSKFANTQTTTSASVSIHSELLLRLQRPAFSSSSRSPKSTSKAPLRRFRLRTSNRLRHVCYVKNPSWDRAEQFRSC